MHAMASICFTALLTKIGFAQTLNKMRTECSPNLPRVDGFTITKAEVAVTAGTTWTIAADVVPTQGADAVPYVFKVQYVPSQGRHAHEKPGHDMRFEDLFHLR